MNDVKAGRREIAAALTRAAVLEAARSLFVTNGFEATSIDDIARSAQASKGAVYHHFADKQEIFTEVFREVQGGIIGAAIERIGEPGKPWERLENGTCAFLRGFVADTEASTLLRQALGVLGWDRVREFDEQTSLPFIRATIEEYIRIGEVAPVDVGIAAQMLFRVYCDAILVVAGAPDPKRAEPEVEAMVLAMLRGLRAGFAGPAQSGPAST
jgi:AcrR family transcriptional regulator